MEFIKEPMTIETRSMEIIKPYVEKYNLNDEETAVYSRMIHASGDPDYANWISISPNAIKAAEQALLAGKDIFCDVEMVRTGINKKRLAEMGGQVHCLVADETVAIKAKELGITRSMMAMRTFGKRLDGAVIAIGNAPTALFEVLAMIEKEQIKPACIIGVPVGFVGAAESKDELIDRSSVPYITVRGNKGGSPIAASVINAIMYLSGR